MIHPLSFLPLKAKQKILIGDQLTFAVNYNPDTRPLPTYLVEWKDPIQNWQSLIANLQNQYLINRNESSPMGFYDTIMTLSNLAMGNGLVDESRSEHLAWAALNLEDFYTLLVDLEVTEVFCNEMNSPMIISHRRYGRCMTNIYFREEVWDALKIRAEYDSGLSLNPSNPALKIGLQTKLGNLRVSIQIPPLTPESPAFNIRRLPEKPILLQDLISQGQISGEHARILLDGLQSRKNIIVAGEPGSGKTTLANALLLSSDPSWRLIVMEDAREIIIRVEDFPLATRFFMPAVGDDNRFSKRADEIARLLHRSPDYVFLGELQNAQDTTVAFEAFAAGVSGMATTHAANFNGLISRWINSHKLDDGLLGSIDLIAFTKREFEQGRIKLQVTSIYKNDGEFREIAG